MRYVHTCAAILTLFAGTSWANEPAASTTENNAAKERIEFDGDTLFLAFQDGNPDLQIKEFLPEGEKLESWSKLAAIHEYPGLNDIKQLATKFAETLDKRNPPAPYDIFEDERTGDVIIDFIVWPEGTENPADAPYVEFNIFRYQTRDEGGLVAQQFAVREYKDIPGFLADLKPTRERLLESMATTGLIVIPGNSALTVTTGDTEVPFLGANVTDNADSDDNTPEFGDSYGND